MHYAPRTIALITELFHPPRHPDPAPIQRVHNQLFQSGNSEPAQEMAKSTEFAIPASSAYALLDASSTLVTQPAVIRDLKVDWSMRS